MQPLVINSSRFGYSALIAQSLARSGSKFSDSAQSDAGQSPTLRDQNGSDVAEGAKSDWVKNREHSSANLVAACAMDPCQKPRLPSLGGANAPSHRILVVDDEPMIRKLNREVLRLSGFQVDTAEDGEAAWDALQMTGYDLVVTDHKMPRMSGVELLQKMHSAGMLLPVIVASGTLTPIEFGLYPWLQPSAILLKPYTLEELLVAVKSALMANADR